MSSIFEIKNHIEVIDKKISELKNMLLDNPDNDIAERLLLLVDTKRALLIDIESAYESTLLIIGSNKLSYNKANRMLSSIKEKISILTLLINSNNCSLDKADLQDQRDKFYMEYIVMETELLKYELSVDVNM